MRSRQRFSRDRPLNGLVGFKLTARRVPLDGVLHSRFRGCARRCSKTTGGRRRLHGGARPLVAAGATIVDLPMAEFAQAAAVSPRGALTSAEAYWWHRQWIKDGADKNMRVRPGEAITAASYVELIKLREQFIRTINAAAGGYYAMLMPTAPETAPTIAETGNDDETYTRFNLRMLRNPARQSVRRLRPVGAVPCTAQSA